MPPEPSFRSTRYRLSSEVPRRVITSGVPSARPLPAASAR